MFDALKDFLIEKNKKNEIVAKKGNDFKAICLLGKNGIKGIGSSGTAEARAIMMATIKSHVEEYVQELKSNKDEEDVEIVTKEE